MAERRNATPREQRRGIACIVETPTATWEIRQDGQIERIGQGGVGRTVHQTLDADTAWHWLERHLSQDAATADRLTDQRGS